MLALPIPDLTSDENGAVQKCLDQLGKRLPRVQQRQRFYDTKRILDSVGFSVPPSMRNLDAVLGWPARAVDGLAGRLHLEGFVQPGSASLHEELGLVFDQNRMAVEWPQAQTAALTAGCAFVAVTPGDVGAGEPSVLMQTMPASEATGVWNVRRRTLDCALWMPDPDGMLPKLLVLFMPSHTVECSRGEGGPWRVKRTPNLLPRVPVTPLAHKPLLGRPFGSSRISRSVIYLCQMAARTLLRTEVSAEFYNGPQRYAMGASAEDFEDEAGNPVSSWETVLGRVWLIGKDEDGDAPTVGQFPQQSMQPNVEMMRMIATLYAAETALPVSSLGIVHDNPASAEAIDAAWADMVQIAELRQVEFGQAAREVAQNALMTRRHARSMDEDLYRIRPKWRDASTPSQAAMADAVSKQIGSGQLVPDSEVGLERSGFDAADIVRIRAEHEAARKEKEKALRALGSVTEGAEGVDAAGDPGDGPPQRGPTPTAGGRVDAGVAARRPPGA